MLETLLPHLEEHYRHALEVGGVTGVLLLRRLRLLKVRAVARELT